MPIIPEVAAPLGLDVERPAVPTNPNAGIIGSSIAGFGEQLAQTSLAVMGKLQDAEASDAVFAAKNSDEAASERQKAQLMVDSPDGYFRDTNGAKVKNPDGTYRTVTQAYRDWANDRYLKTIDTMPNPIAKQAYRQQGGGFFTGEMDHMFGQEQVRRVAASRQAAEDQSRMMADRMISTPAVYSNMDPFYSSAQGLIDQRMQGVTNRIYDATTAKQLTNEDLSKLAQANMSGYIQTIVDQSKNGSNGYDSKGDIQRALDVLDEKDPTSIQRNKNGLFTLGSVLDPMKKEVLRKQLLSLRDSGQTVSYDLANFRNTLKDAGGVASQTGVGVPAFKHFLDVGTRTFVANGQLTQTQLADELAQTILLPAVKHDLNSDWFAMQPEAAQRAIKDKHVASAMQMLQKNLPPGVDSSLVGGHFTGETAAQFDSAIDSYAAEYKRDSAAFVVNHSKDLKAQMYQLEQQGPSKWGSDFAHFLSQVDMQVKSKAPGQISDWREVPKDFSAYVADQIQNPNNSNPEAKAFMMNRMYKAAPKAWGAFLDQMITDKNLSPEYEYVKIMPTVSAAREFMSTLSVSPKIIKDQFEASGKGKYEDFEKAVKPIISDWVNSVIQKNPSFDPKNSDMSVKLYDFFVRKSAQIYMNNRAASPEDAGKQAYQALIKNSGSVTQSTQAGQKVYRNYPNFLQDGTALSDDTKKSMDSWVDDHSKDFSYYKTIGASPPGNYLKQTQARKISDQDAVAQWQNQILHTARWVPNKSGADNYLIYYTDRYSGTDQVLTDSGGNPIKVPFKNAIQSKNSPQPKQWYENLWDSIKGGAETVKSTASDLLKDSSATPSDTKAGKM